MSSDKRRCSGEIKKKKRYLTTDFHFFTQTQKPVGSLTRQISNYCNKNNTKKKNVTGQCKEFLIPLVSANNVHLNNVERWNKPVRLKNKIT